MLSDVSRAKAYFNDEYNATPVDDKPLVEYISPTVCRVNLSAWKRLNLNPDWLWRLFVASMSSGVQKSDEVFASYIAQADKLCDAGKFPFPYIQWKEYIQQYDGNPVRHSPEYREKESPAYRIITNQATKMLPIFESMAGQSGGVIAIDGRAAAGKSTFAKGLSEILNGNKPIIVEMDDFFLPPNFRTVERLTQPGGNIHHERFIEEVLPHIRSQSAFEYRKFDCRIMAYNGTTIAHAHPWRIVEGVYSCHPALGSYMDIRVFLDIEPPIQQARIEKRNTPKIAADYLSKWIPMEEAYFKAYDIRATADIVLHLT